MARLVLEVRVPELVPEPLGDAPSIVDQAVARDKVTDVFNIARQQGEGVGVEVASGVGAGVCTGLADGPQLTVRKPIRRRKNARRQLSRFRSIVNTPIKTR